MRKSPINHFGNSFDLFFLRVINSAELFYDEPPEATRTLKFPVNELDYLDLSIPRHVVIIPSGSEENISVQGIFVFDCLKPPQKNRRGFR